MWTPQLLQGYWCSNEPSIVRRECTVTVLWSNAFPSSLLKKRTCGREARGRLVHCGQQGSSLLRHVAANWQDGSTNDRRIHASSASCINPCGRAFPSMASSPCALLYGKNYTWKKNNHSCDGATRSWIICSPAGRWTISSKIQIRCVTSGKGFSRCGQRGWLKQSITWLIKRKREKWTSIKPIHLRVSPWLRTLEVTMKIPRSSLPLSYYCHGCWATAPFWSVHWRHYVPSCIMHAKLACKQCLV